MDLLTLMLARGNSGGIPISKVSDLENDAGYITASALGPYAQQDAVETALAGKQNKLTFDNVPLVNSNNPVKSGGVASAIADAITDAISGITSFEYYLCGQGEYDPSTGEPTVANPDANHIYLTPTGGTNLYMYAYIDQDFVFLGTTEIDLTNYVTEDDLEDYALKTDVPDVPENVSELNNDAGYITNPRTSATAITVEHMSPSDYIAGVVGNVNVCVISSQATTAQISAIIAACESENPVYLNTNEYELGKMIQDPDYLMAYNVERSEADPAPITGMQIADASKPVFIIMLGENEEAAHGYALTVITSAPVEDGEWKLFYEGRYLTEHQSLNAYAKKTEVNTALALKADASTVTAALAQKADASSVTQALAGKSNNGHTHAWTEITSKPGNIVTGDTKAYTIAVSNSAPAAGTADSVITIVV